MKNLIKMTDFVLEQAELLRYRDDCEFAYLARKYANFIKQTNEKWMFVPCDEQGNVLEEPDHLDYKIKNEFGELIFMSDLFKNRYSNDYDKYQKAKERCLFEGFEVQDTKDWIEFYGGIRVYIPSNDLGSMVSIVFRESEPINKTIEDLVKYNLQLTPTAIKQLGL